MLRVKEICTQKGITLKILAEKLEISAPSLTEQITGNPKLSNLQRIADALGVHITELFAPPTDIKIFVEYNGETTPLTEKDIIEAITKKRNEP